MTRVQEALRPLETPGGAISDEQVELTCPTCKTTQRLSQARLREEDEQTVYTCRRGCQIVLVVSRPDPSGKPWPGRGYRLGDWVIRNATDLKVHIPGKIGGLLFPASPATLDTVRPRDN